MRNYGTIQVNEAIMQNTGGSPPFDPPSYPKKPLSGFLSTYLSASFISWDWEQLETSSTFHYTHVHNLNLFTDKYNFEEYFAVEPEPPFTPLLPSLIYHGCNVSVRVPLLHTLHTGMK